MRKALLLSLLALSPGIAWAQQPGVSIFSIDDPLEFLMSIDAHPQLLFGFLVFEGLGLTITGYHDGDVGQRAICLFMRERFRPFSADMTPYVP